MVIIGGGVAGYVAAIKAGQEGLKVCNLPPSSNDKSMSNYQLGDMYREAWRTGRNLPQRRLYPFESSPQQLAFIPPDPSRLETQRH